MIQSPKRAHVQPASAGIDDAVHRVDDAEARSGGRGNPGTGLISEEER